MSLTSSNSTVQPDLGLKPLLSCPLCHGQNRKPLYVLEKSTVFRCNSCRLAYLDPCLDPAAMAELYQSSDSLKSMHDFHEGYYEYGSLEEDSKTLKEFCQGLDAVERVFGGTSKKLFEVGYGNGLFLALARQRGWTVDGIDTSSVNKQVAKNRFGLDLREGFFEKMPGEVGEWDTVAMMDVIEHISEPYDILKKAAGLLRPGGILLLGTPNQSGFFAKLSHVLWRLSGGFIRSGIDKIYFLEHVTYYDKKTLGELLQKAGFEPLVSFCAETDLAKFKLKPMERVLGEMILFFGRVFKSGNRLVMIAKKRN